MKLVDKQQSLKQRDMKREELKKQLEGLTLKEVAVYDRDEKSLTLYDENGTEHFFENKKLFLKKNGYPEKSSNWVDIEINDPFDFGENPRYELIYLRAADGKFIFEARKIRDGYVLTADDAMKEIGKLE